MVAMVGTDMPLEAESVFIKKILAYKELLNSVKTENPEIILNTLIDCAMTDIQLMRVIPNLDQSGLIKIMGREEEMAFKKRLQTIHASWPKQ